MLFDEFSSFARFTGDQFFVNTARSKNQVFTNLNPRFTIRNYQEEALGRLFYYLESYQHRKNPVHLMFNMATGSGKTLIMAASIVYLYQQGYRNFIFFTRLDNIIQKTKDNFVNSASSKFVFNQSIWIDGRSVSVKEVETFESASDDDINIMFSSTSLLHKRMTTPKENAVTFEDLGNQSIVFLADEAHNLSAETSAAATGKNNIERSNWENTVLGLLRASRGHKNVLLEFTATARLEVRFPEIMEKYREKAIYKYDLKQFRLDGFSKNVKTVQVNAPLAERVLVAVVISQYRRKIAEKYRLPIKPVVLFKSNRVTPPTNREQLLGANPKIVVSSEFKKLFHEIVSNLTIDTVNELRSIEDDTLQKAFSFFGTNGINDRNLIAEIQMDFSEERCLSVDDDNDLRDHQVLLNSLEEPTNQIRAVFATEKLNEGWDVLNLFDIVRLYDTRDARANVAGKTTVQEAQLIGRGARYCPLQLNVDDDAYVRKFDSNSQNELSILEYLYYHSATNPRYIQELEGVLVNEGIIASSKIKRELTIKEEFKDTWFWKSGMIYLNTREQMMDVRNAGQDLLQVAFDFNADWNIYKIPTRTAIETDVFTQERISKKVDSTTKRFQLVDLGANVIRKALDGHPGMRFVRLKQLFNRLQSVDEFIHGSAYLGNVSVQVESTAERLHTLSQDDKLAIAKFVIDRISQDLRSVSGMYRGSKTFFAHKIQDAFQDKVLNLDEDSYRARRMSSYDLSSKRWYAQNELWGTSEEEALVRFVDSQIETLKKIYQDVALIRNEMHVKIFDFQRGDPFYPDFLLLLRRGDGSATQALQVFIEPKGDAFLDAQGRFEGSQEAWKQSFLTSIEAEHVIELILESPQFKLIGLPFFNDGRTNLRLNSDFTEAFSERLIRK
jgi:type III restriction enzyme